MCYGVVMIWEINKILFSLIFNVVFLLVMVSFLLTCCAGLFGV